MMYPQKIFLWNGNLRSDSPDLRKYNEPESLFPGEITFQESTIDPGKYAQSCYDMYN